MRFKVLDAAVSTKRKKCNQEGKQSPESVDSNHSPTLPVKETIQKSLESRRIDNYNRVRYKPGRA